MPKEHSCYGIASVLAAEVLSHFLPYTLARLFCGRRRFEELQNVYMNTPLSYAFLLSVTAPRERKCRLAQTIVEGIKSPHDKLALHLAIFSAAQLLIDVQNVASDG